MGIRFAVDLRKSLHHTLVPIGHGTDTLAPNSVSVEDNVCNPSSAQSRTLRDPFGLETEYCGQQLYLVRVFEHKRPFRIENFLTKGGWI